MAQSLELITLANGTRVVLVPMKGLRSLTVLAMVGVGSRYEKTEQAGISHFLEHLPFKGTQQYPTALELSSAIDGVGGKHNAFTGKEYTGYWVKLAGERWQLALDLVSDLLLTAHLRPEDIEKEKGVIIEEINMYEDQPQAKVSELYDALVYEGSGLEREVIGYSKTVSLMRREDFVGHWDRWYDPHNVVLGLVGDISHLPTGEQERREALEVLMNKGNMRRGGGERMFGVPEQTGKRMNIFFKQTEQAHFHLGFPGLAQADERRYILSILSTILGGNSSSKLFNEVREKRGLAYYAYASVDRYQDAGSLYAFEGVTLDKIGEAIKVTLGEFEAMKAGEFTDEDVERAKQYVVGKMTLDLEDSANMANLVVRKLLLEGELLDLDQLIERVTAVSKEQIVSLAQELIVPHKMNLAVVGPYKDAQVFEGYLGE